MQFYRICDFVFQSNTELPELEETFPTEPAYSFHLLPPYNDGAGDYRQPLHQPAIREEWPVVVCKETSYWLSFPGLADFEFIANERIIRCYPLAEVPQVTIRHLLLDQVMPIVTSHEPGRVVLHASAVATAGGALVFLGPSGQGKSSLAGSFCQNGFQLLTDDFLIVEEQAGTFCGLPSYPALRLWPEAVSAVIEPHAQTEEIAHYTRKRWLPIRRTQLSFGYHSIPLKRLYLLAPPPNGGSSEPAIRLEPVPPQQALVELTKCLFRLDPYDREKFQEEFFLLGQLVSSIQVFRLSYARRFDLLQAVRETILDTLDCHIERLCNTLSAGEYV